VKRALKEQSRFRSRQRSTSRLRERGTSTVRDGSPERKHRDRSSSRKPTEREASRSRNEPSPHPRREQRPSHARATSELTAGNLSQLKDDRTMKKEAAARELEERRKSLAQRPSVPPIVHPEELARLSPMIYQPISPPEFTRASTFPSPKQQTPPTRSHTASPGHQQQRTGDYNSSGVQVGLPATPRAMRHPKYDPEGRDIPEVPQIPEKYDAQPPTWGSLNTVTYNNAFESLAPLPKSVYQGFSPRRVPPRSASAPIPEEPMVPNSPYPLPAGLPTHPAFQAALPPSSRRRGPEANLSRISTGQPSRKVNPGTSQPGTLGYESRNNSPVYSNKSGFMGGIDETLEASAQPINPSNNSLTPPPPPPPPAPPILKELQHLAIPPPPPPAPLYRPGNPNTSSMVSGVSSQGSQVIEIVMDDEDEKAHSAGEVPAPPMAPFARDSRISHSRGRSETDNSISMRFSRAAERLRSASRGRNTSSPEVNRTKSPLTDPSPYESVPPQWPSGRSANNTPQVPAFPSNGHYGERHPREIMAAMKESEGGMI